MTEMEGVVQQQNVARASDGTTRGIRLTRDGAILQVPWIQALCLEGRVMGASGGSASLVYTGPGSFGTGAIDTDEFDYLQTIPTTVAVIPVFYNAIFELVGTVDFVSNLLVWGHSAVSGGTDFALVPYNLRPGAGIDSLCSIIACAATGGTAITLGGTVFMSGSTMMSDTTTTGANVLPPYTATTCSYIAVIEGSATASFLAGFHSGQAQTGYLLSQGIELPIAMIR